MRRFENGISSFFLLVMHVTIVVLFFVIFSGAPVLGNESAPGVKNDLSVDRTDVKIKRRDLDLVISAALVLARLGNNEDIVLVDVRAPEDFRQFRIPGSLPQPPTMTPCLPKVLARSEGE